MLSMLIVVAMQAGLQPAAGGEMADPTRVVRPCPAEAGPEVVVCGRKGQEQYRLRPLLDRFVAREGLSRAEMRVGMGTVGVAAQDAGVGGFTSHRAMAAIKLPF